MAVFGFIHCVLVAMVLGAQGKPHPKQLQQQPYDGVAMLDGAMTYAVQVVSHEAIDATNQVLSSLHLSPISVPASYSVSHNPGNTCNNEMIAREAADVLEDTGKSLADNLFLGVGHAFLTSGSSGQMAQKIQESFHTFPDSFRRGTTIPSFSGGQGAGFGFEVFCGSELIFSFGAGGGGGMHGVSGTAGGGGGGQSASPDIVNAGGGVGCSFANPSAYPVCSNHPDGSGVAPGQVQLRVRNSMNACRQPVLVCGGGGGGGGFTSAGGCQYGAGYSFSFDQQLKQGVAAGNLTSPAAECPSSGGQRYDLAVAQAANICSTNCVGSSDFNACYCPCFKGKIEGLGLSWGFVMSCN